MQIVFNENGGRNIVKGERSSLTHGCGSAEVHGGGGGLSPQKAEEQKKQRRVKRHGGRRAEEAGGGLRPERRRAGSRWSSAKGATGQGDSHKVRPSDSELQVINATASGSWLTEAPPSWRCVCVGEREGNTCPGRT